LILKDLLRAFVDPASQPPPRLLHQLRGRIRLRHYSLRTERTYGHWVKRYVAFHGMRHPGEMGAAEVTAFLSALATERNVAAATQNQALSAILFLYKEVLGVELPWLDEVRRAKKPRRLPTVLTQAEVRALLAHIEGVNGLIARLLYGTGMRLMEGARLRVKDVDLERREVIVRQGKGGRDRVTMLPDAIVIPLRQHLARVHERFLGDRAAELPGVELPHAFGRKNPNARKQWGWQWVFPSHELLKRATTSAPCRSSSATRM
jgi:integron integrase